MGFDRILSDAACFEFDAVIARFANWAEGRMRETTGGKRPQPKYPTLGEALGMQDEDILSHDSDEMKSAGSAYMQALVLAIESGTELPDPAKFVPDSAAQF